MAASNAPLEVVFSLDTTGSMGSYLDEVRARLSDIVKRLKADIPGIRISILAHGDSQQLGYCDSHNYVTRYVDFTRDIKKLCNFVKETKGTWGGDTDECYELALHEVRTKLSWQPGSQRALVMIGDSNPHEPDYPENELKLDWRDEVDSLKNIGVRIYGVRCDSFIESEEFFQAISLASGGKYLKLSDFTQMSDCLVAVCYSEKGPEMVQIYENEVKGRDPVNDDTIRLLGVLLGRESYEEGPPSTSLEKRASLKTSLSKKSSTRATPTSLKPALSKKSSKPKPALSKSSTAKASVSSSNAKTKTTKKTATPSAAKNKPTKKLATPATAKAKPAKKTTPSSTAKVKPSKKPKSTVKSKPTRKPAKPPTTKVKPTKTRVPAKQVRTMKDDLSKYKLENLPRHRREEVPEKNFLLGNMAWSKWQLVISPSAKGSCNQQRKSGKVGYRKKEIFSKGTHAPALYEIAVQPRPRHRKRVLYSKCIQKGLREDWEKALFCCKNIAKQIESVVKKGCDVYVRRLELKGTKQKDNVTNALKRYDYAWAIISTERYQHRPVTKANVEISSEMED